MACCTYYSVSIRIVVHHAKWLQCVHVFVTESPCASLCWHIVIFCLPRHVRPVVMPAMQFLLLAFYVA